MKRILLFMLLTVHICLQAQSAPTSDSAIHKMVVEAKQYLTGVGKVKDEAKAYQIYLQCAEQGNAEAMNALGILYKQGVGVNANREQAIEWFTKAGSTGYSQGWYNLGLMYKDAKGEEQDYIKSYQYFSKGADLGDEESIYAKGYLLYKGLGCQQNYSQATRLFMRGAAINKPNSMYFLGLCYRNGYGINTNIDSARKWLSKAADKGYRMAIGELKSPNTENDNQKAVSLALQLKDAFTSTQSGLNTYRKIAHNIPANAIEGKYEGYLIRYDWSGKHAIGSVRLVIELTSKDNQLVGNWIENDSIRVPIEAILTSDAIVFKNMTYKRTDHYSTKNPMPYRFDQAKLQWIRKGDTVYVAGNLQLFSIRRNEPEKPLYLSLTRAAATTDNMAMIQLRNEDGSLQITKDIKAYPNPFNSVLTVEFTIQQDCEVQTQLLTLDGKIVYDNRAGLLQAGSYRLPIQPNQLLISGAYILKLQYGKKSKTVEVIKQ